jgi:hypothetical protein
LALFSPSKKALATARCAEASISASLCRRTQDMTLAEYADVLHEMTSFMQCLSSYLYFFDILERLGDWI